MKKEIKGIGGWLLVLIILLIYVGVYALIKFFSSNDFSLLIPAILILITLIFMFKKKKIAKILFYFSIWVPMAYLLVTEFVYYNYSFVGISIWLVKYFILPVIITLYFALSKRVNNTFVN